MTSNNEIAFDLSLYPRGLRSLAVNHNDMQESEISGSLGSINRINVLDGEILEIQGTLGIMRLSMPDRYLELFEKQSSCKNNG